MLRSRGTLWFIAILALGCVGLIRSLVIVDQSEAVYVTEFGRPVRLLTEPGPAWKWPYQSRRGFDLRLQLERPPAREMLTKDKKNLEVAWYAQWRIQEVERFLKAVPTMADASSRLEDLTASVLAAEMGQRDLADLIQVGRDSALEALAIAVRQRVADQAQREYGIEVLEVRLRGLNYPEDVRPAVYEQIRSERRKVATATRSEGESQARMIRSAAERDRSKVVAEAESEAARLIGEGEAQAARIVHAAHAADPDFYEFLTTLETYKIALDGKTTLILSTESDFLKLLTDGVAGARAGQPPRPTALQPGRSADHRPVSDSTTPAPDPVRPRGSTGGSSE